MANEQLSLVIVSTEGEAFEVPHGACTHSGFLTDSPGFEAPEEVNNTFEIPAMDSLRLGYVAAFLSNLAEAPFDPKPRLTDGENVGDYELPQSMNLTDNFPRVHVDWVNTIPGLFLPELKRVAGFMQIPQMMDLLTWKVLGLIFRRNSEQVCEALGIEVAQLPPGEAYYIDWCNPTFLNPEERFGLELDDETSTCPHDLTYLPYFTGFNWGNAKVRFNKLFEDNGLDLLNLPEGFNIAEFLFNLRASKASVELTLD